jgi:signal transduction histidine kinase/FixJ family two-component response regulator
MTLSSSKLRPTLSLRWVLIVPFVVQILVAVGVVGYFSAKNGHRAVNDLANQLIDKAGQRVDTYLDGYLSLPHQINQLNADAIAAGQLNLNNPRASEQYFWRQAKAFPNLTVITYALKDGRESGAGRWLNGEDLLVYENLPGDGQATDYLADERGNRTKVTQTFDLDPLTAYAELFAAEKPQWGDTYVVSTDNLALTADGAALLEKSDSPADPTSAYISLPAVYPIYQKSQKVGILTAEISLVQISEFLQGLKVSPAGQVFITERNGSLVGSSSQYPVTHKIQDEQDRYTLNDTPDPLIRSVHQALQQQAGGLQAIEKSRKMMVRVNGQRQFVQIMPWRDRYGLDLLVVVAIPESDFMAQIHANNRTTFLLCCAALGLAIALGIYTSRWIAQPILKLKAASRAIAAGDLDQMVQIKGINELETLADSFNQMAGQLKTSFVELENRVEERTAALKEAKLVADNANQAKSEFLANMSHELRTPLNGILGYAQILRRSKALPHKERHGVDIIYQCGSHLLTLINDILDLSKIEARKLDLAPQMLHLPSFLQGVVEICRVRSDQKGIEFLYEAEADLPEGIKADEKRLRQVLINLLGNAIKFTNQGTVTLKVEVLERTESIVKLFFCVADTGVGIATDEIDKIFQEFEQVGDQKKQSEGTGLGLAISQKIVELMGSRIQVKSQIGVGSDFFFEAEFAIAEDWVQRRSDQDGRTIVGYEGEPRHILIVDDRWENRTVLTNLLEPIGFQFTEAENGQEGLEKIRQCLPDLIITDLAMPVMDGFEMLKQLRAVEAWKNLLVLVSSASVAELDQQISLEAGGNDFLVKPVQVDELLTLLAKYLKLTWKYEEAESGAADLLSTAELIPPPAEDLERLLELAQDGMLKELSHAAEHIGQQDDRYQPFAQQVLQFAKQFQTEKIESFIQQYLA